MLGCFSAKFSRPLKMSALGRSQSPAIVLRSLISPRSNCRFQVTGSISLYYWGEELKSILCEILGRRDLVLLLVTWTRDPEAEGEPGEVRGSSFRIISAALNNYPDMQLTHDAQPANCSRGAHWHTTDTMGWWAYIIVNNQSYKKGGNIILLHD